MSVKEITSENFEEEVMQANETVLVDFWASWCMPCKMLSPVVDEVAEEFENIKVGKVNIDENQELARKYEIMSIPTLIVFKNGEIVNKSVGVIPKEDIKKMLK